MGELTYAVDEDLLYTKVESAIAEDASAAEVLKSVRINMEASDSSDPITVDRLLRAVRAPMKLIESASRAQKLKQGEKQHRVNAVRHPNANPPSSTNLTKPPVDLSNVCRSFSFYGNCKEGKACPYVHLSLHKKQKKALCREPILLTRLPSAL